ncbi:hypothetical protein Hanom_Chr03g00203591 [Helianthus anomalus]
MLHSLVIYLHIFTAGMDHPVRLHSIFRLCLRTRNIAIFDTHGFDYSGRLQP